MARVGNRELLSLLEPLTDRTGRPLFADTTILTLRQVISRREQKTRQTKSITLSKQKNLIPFSDPQKESVPKSPDMKGNSSKTTTISPSRALVHSSSNKNTSLMPLAAGALNTEVTRESDSAFNNNSDSDGTTSVNLKDKEKDTKKPENQINWETKTIKEEKSFQQKDHSYNRENKIEDDSHTDARSSRQGDKLKGRKKKKRSKHYYSSDSDSSTSDSETDSGSDSSQPANSRRKKERKSRRSRGHHRSNRRSDRPPIDVSRSCVMYLQHVEKFSDRDSGDAGGLVRQFEDALDMLPQITDHQKLFWFGTCLEGLARRWYDAQRLGNSGISY
jgi:hypothetical protein